MYTSPTVSDPAVGPHLFLCLGCDTGGDETTCSYGWSTCDCVGCRQSLRLERYDRRRFDYLSVRGLLVLGCAGGSNPPEEVQAQDEEPVEIDQPVMKAPPAEPAAPATPPVPPAKVATASFRAMVRLCGLSHAEAAEILNLSESAVKKKSSGALGVTGDDISNLQAIWGKIQRGDLAGLPPGAADAAAALQALGSA